MNAKPKTSLDLFMENVKLEENSPVRNQKSNISGGGRRNCQRGIGNVPRVDRISDEEYEDSFLKLGQENLNSLNKIRRKISGASSQRIQVLSLIKTQSNNSNLSDNYFK